MKKQLLQKLILISFIVFAVVYLLPVDNLVFASSHDVVIEPISPPFEGEDPPVGEIEIKPNQRPPRSVNAGPVCTELTSFCASIEQGDGYDDPSILAIFCPFARLLNISIFLVGAVIIIYVAYGAIKMAAGLGDPKAFDAARDTWTWLVVGAGIVFGFYFVFFALANLIGIDLGTGLLSPSCIMDQLFLRFKALLEGACILEGSCS